MLAQHHLVEWRGEAAVDVVSVEDGHSDDAAHKVEVGQVIGVNAGVWIDLERIDVVPGILKKEELSDNRRDF